MMSTTGFVGSPAGFLARISALEREVGFLKQKVEDDARWKHIVQQFVLDNFAFDIQATVLRGIRRQSHRSRPTVPTVLTRRKKKPSSPVKVEARARIPEVECLAFLDEGGVASPSSPFGGIVITPDICTDVAEEEPAGSSSGGTANRSANETTATATATATADSVTIEESDEEVPPPQSSGSDSEDSSVTEEQARRPHRKMEWTLIATYPNVATMKQQFNLSAWGLSTKQVGEKGVKIYYYCKECRKHGPGRLHVRYQREDGIVEIFKNQLEHDHSTKKRLTDEMKFEIVNLYNAGMTDSTKILEALKITKPLMRPPTTKQICHLLKPLRKVERDKKIKEKRKAAKEKEKQKQQIPIQSHRPKKSKRDSSSGGMTPDSVMLPPFPPSTSGPGGSGSTSGFYHGSHILSASTFPTQFYQTGHFESGGQQYP